MHEQLLAGTWIMWVQTVTLAATIELPYGEHMLPNVEGQQVAGLSLCAMRTLNNLYLIVALKGGQMAEWQATYS